MRCPKCASEVNDGVKFCNECGYEIGVKTREDQISNLISQSAFRVLGWIFIPFVMIFVSWNGLRNVGKFYGTIWASIAAIYAITVIAGHNTDKQLISPVTAAVEQKTLLSNEENTAKVQADALKEKVQKEAEARAKKEADDKAKADSASKALDKDPHIGEAAEVGKLNVAVWKGPLTGPTVGEGILKHNAKGIYWLIRVGVGNRDKESRTIDSHMFKLVGPDGTTYDPDTTAGRYANNQTHFFLEKINPGIDIEGFLVFDMPASLGIDRTDDFILRVESGIWSKAGQHVDFVLKKR